MEATVDEDGKVVPRLGWMSWDQLHGLDDPDRGYTARILNAKKRRD